MLIAENLHKTYRRNTENVRVLSGVNLEVRTGEFVCVTGASGSGKSTLLHLLGTLDRPDTGSVKLDCRRIDDLPSRERDLHRNRTFGFIFQFYHLLPELNALENVMVPAMVGSTIRGWFRTRREAKKRAAEILDRVGLSHRLRHRPRELSGGEMQRTAIARALITRPRLLLADEPTGNLDAENGASVVKLLHDLNREDNLTIVMVTHNNELAAGTSRTVRLVGGRIDQPRIGLVTSQAG
jgi:lipoprotein-releasing system ATP-binding protein